VLFLNKFSHCSNKNNPVQYKTKDFCKKNPPELPNFEEKDFEIAILRQSVLGGHQNI
jgi:hypothetical protein